MASSSKRRSRVKKRSHARIASAGAILGAAAALTQVGCGTEDEAPPIDYNALADGGGPVLDAQSGGAPSDAETDSTLVDLDGEADARSAAHDGSTDGGVGAAPDGGRVDAEVS